MLPGHRAIPASKFSSCPVTAWRVGLQALGGLLGNLNWEWPDFGLCFDSEIVRYSVSAIVQVRGAVRSCLLPPPDPRCHLLSSSGMWQLSLFSVHTHSCSSREHQDLPCSTHFCLSLSVGPSLPCRLQLPSLEVSRVYNPLPGSRNTWRPASLPPRCPIL